MRVHEVSITESLRKSWRCCAASKRMNWAIRPKNLRISPRLRLN